MANTSFLFWNSPDNNFAVFLAEDNTDVCQVFEQVFQGTRYVDQQDFVDLFLGSSLFSVCLVDSEIIVGRARSAADEWLTAKNIQHNPTTNKCVVVYSGGTGSSRIAFRWFLKSSNAYAEDFSRIRTLTEQTVNGQLELECWPFVLGFSEILSQTIHSLDNALLPIKLDLETLVQTKNSSEILKEIFADYFSECGYLTERCNRIEYSDIITIFKTNLDKLGTTVINDFILNKRYSELTKMIVDLRKSYAELKNDENRYLYSLQNDLKLVLEKGASIVSHLRDLRERSMVQANEKPNSDS